MNDGYGWVYWEGEFLFYGPGENKPLTGKVLYKRTQEGDLAVVVECVVGNNVHSVHLPSEVLETKLYKPGLHRISKVQVALNEQYIELIPNRVLPVHDSDDFKEVTSGIKLLFYLFGLLVLVFLANTFEIWLTCLGGIISFVAYTAIYARFIGFTEHKSLCKED
jgi:hypothetical protein